MSDATESKLEEHDRYAGAVQNVAVAGDDDDDDEPTGKQQKERRKIEIKFIQDKSRRHITFSKRKAGIMKKAYELSVLTGTQVLLLVVSETGLVYTFTTPKLQPLVTKSEGKNLIQACLNAPEEGLGDDQDDQSDGNSQDSPDQSPAPQQQQQQQAQQQAQQQHAAAAAAAAQVHHNAQAQQAQLSQLPPGAQIPHGMPYLNTRGQPQQPGLPIPPNAYADSSVYQQYFSNINGNIPNQQPYQ